MAVAAEHDQQVALYNQKALVKTQAEEYAPITTVAKHAGFGLLDLLRNRIPNLQVKTAVDAKHLADAAKTCVNLYRELREGLTGKEEEEGGKTSDEITITHTMRLRRMVEKVEALPRMIEQAMESSDDDGS